MTSPKGNASDNQPQFKSPEIFTIMDDDGLQQNIISAAPIAAGSRRKSTAVTNEIFNSPTIKKANIIGHRRRKTFHKILNNADDEITFESVIPQDLQEVRQKNRAIEPEKAQKAPQIQKHNKTTKSRNSIVKTYKTSYANATDYLTRENPNTEFIQRVAFLRSCVNYMLKSAGKEAIDFNYGDNTLSKLVNNYNCVSNEPEEIVLSD